MLEQLVSNEAERIRKEAVVAKIHVITPAFTWTGWVKPKNPKSERLFSGPRIERGTSRTRIKCVTRSMATYGVRKKNNWDLTFVSAEKLDGACHRPVSPLKRNINVSRIFVGKCSSYINMSRDSSVNNENGCGLDDEISIPCWERYFSLGRTLRPHYIKGTCSWLESLPLLPGYRCRPSDCNNMMSCRQNTIHGHCN
jgi:hypothetical protein